MKKVAIIFLALPYTPALRVDPVVYRSGCKVHSAVTQYQKGPDLHKGWRNSQLHWTTKSPNQTSLWGPDCTRVATCGVKRQSQSQRLPRSSLLAADLTAKMETVAQRHGSIDDSFGLPNFPHMGWVGPSAWLTKVMIGHAKRLGKNWKSLKLR